MAMSHAVFIWNHLPNKTSCLSPEELLSGLKTPMAETILQSLRVWGCPTYVLSPKLQDGKKIPKWDARARRGQYLGIFLPSCNLGLST